MVHMNTTGTGSDHEAEAVDVETEHINRSVGAEIRVLRARRGWNQSELAVAVGLDKKTIGRLERGERSMTVGQMYRLCKVFGIKPSELVRAVEGEVGIE